ncbi:hypothetical protein FEF34_23100 [Streptomyces marianii]|uniref:Uncharacterized protein n=1 Tax=Streptomyces marianii TaxID=1817406 RepID=A0A5R9E676_9ACTN|nr:hypothetical protein FEF34_23100 [Streptomyces marianii]
MSGRPGAESARCVGGPDRSNGRPRTLRRSSPRPGARPTSAPYGPSGRPKPGNPCAAEGPRPARHRHRRRAVVSPRRKARRR